ncbi:hypothetical protein GALL_491890 [mine drainage metagenome]|uniref:Uncharacterized protein n=1 Tax=mine drainage metagenome TaxID=410659 RepID=A0A1J5PV87_9ZZZZ
MHAHDQHLFVVRAIEDADAPALGQVAGGAPEEVVLKFLRTRMLKAEHLAALRVDARHHVANRAVLACRVHRLKHQQQGMAVRRVEQALLVAELLHVVSQQIVIGLLRFAQSLGLRGPADQVNRIAFADLECSHVDVHVGNSRCVAHDGDASAASTVVCAWARMRCKCAVPWKLSA